MIKKLNNHKLEFILASFLTYLLVFLDRYTFEISLINLSTLFSWTLYYLLMYILYFIIIYIFKSSTLYIYKWLKKYYKESKNKFAVIIVVMIIISSILIRMLMSLKHFTHWDDFGVVSTMFEQSNATPWERIGFYVRWTYAPFQYTLNTGLLNKNYSYELNMVLGRLPSLVCGILNIMLIFKFITKLKINKNINLIILGTVLIGYSWENIIYSSQMAPYSIAITMILFMINKYIDILERKETKISDYIYLTLISIVACYSQYQLYIFIFGLYLALFITNILSKNKKEVIYVIISGIITLVASIPILLVIFNHKLLDSGIAWNAGIDSQFRLKYTHKGIMILIDIIAYVIKNLILCIRAFFIYKKGNIFTTFLAILIFILSLIGFINTNRNKKQRKYILFYDIVLIVYFIMILKGSLVLSPSRHNLVLIPIIIFNLINGLIYIQDKNKEVGKVIVISLIATISIIFISTFKTEYKNRKNPINTRYFLHLIYQYNPISVSSIYWGIFSTNYLNIPGYIDHHTFIRAVINPNNTNHKRFIIYNIDGKLKQKNIDELLDGMTKFQIPVEYKDTKKWKLLYEYEVKNKTEIEYAYGVFDNHPNSFYCYVIEMEE